MSVELVAAAGSPDRFPRDGLPQVAFVGRSNVGKSSLLNTLVMRGKKRRGAGPISKRQLAHTSRTPGRTQTINFYRLDDKFYFVDLPGYGYAKASKQAMDEWQRVAEQYLVNEAALRAVVLLVDIRHGPTALDRQMKQWLESNGRPLLVVATKADKLKRSQLAKAVDAIQKTFYPPVVFSAVSGVGVDPLWDAILNQVRA
jgi:GTP-binding protein